MKKSELKKLIKGIVAEIRAASLTEAVKRRFIVRALVASNQSNYWEQNIIASSKEEALQMANKNQPDNPTTLAKVEEIPLSFSKRQEKSLDTIQSLENDMEKMEKNAQRREAEFHRDFGQLKTRVDQDLKGIRAADAELTPAMTEHILLKRIIKEEVYGERTYKYGDGTVLTIDENGVPKDENKWTDLGYRNGWEKNSREQQLLNANKNKKWYTINLNRSGTKEGTYCPEALLWYQVDSSD